MSSRYFFAGLFSVLFASPLSLAQSDQYKRSKPAADKPVVVDPAKPGAAPTGASPVPESSDKVDVSDLEKKYWAPKDTDFSVVQNRTYSKQGKVAISALYGLHVNDSFSDGNEYGLAANYFWAERYGMELQYTKSNLRDNDLVAKVVDEGGFPDHVKVDSFYGVNFNWIPVYAKASLLGKRIIYFDLAISPGIGMTTYQQQSYFGEPKSAGIHEREKSSFTYTLDLTQYFFISKYFALRIDIKNRWYKSEVLDGRSGANKGKESETTTLFLLGGTFYF